jgi:ketosteroid isomerase-like protein
LSNADIVRQLMERFEAGDFEGQLELIDPDVVLVEWPEAPDTKTAHGHAGVRQINESWFEAWEWIRTEVDEFVESGDRVLARGRTSGKGKGSEVEVEIDSFNVYTLRRGKVTRMEFFTKEEPAREAAGLSEKEEAK